MQQSWHLRLGLFCLMVFASLTLYVGAAPIAHAATTINVTTTADEISINGNCSLREAIQAANNDVAIDACPAGSGADTINLPAGVYKIAIAGQNELGNKTGDFNITHDVNIIGAGVNATIIDGNQLDRVFEIHSVNSVPVNVTLTGITIRNGKTDAGGGGIRFDGNLTLIGSTVTGNTSNDGGGLFGPVSAGRTLDLRNSTITANHAPDGAGLFALGGNVSISQSSISENISPNEGAGIFNGSGATMTITASTVSTNSVTTDCCGGAIGNGAGILSYGILTISNSTISGNQASGNGGGIYNRTLDFTFPAKLALNNVTIANNTADQNADGGGDGGGIFTYEPVISSNTIFARNIDNGGQAPDCAGTITSQGYNLIEHPGGCNLTGNLTGNIFPADARIGPLNNGGGPTLVHPLLVRSPARDAGNPATSGSGGNACAATDQRGVKRPQDGDNDGTARCDIGSFEATTTANITYASDDFSRAVTNGWGGAPVGGNYALRGATSDFFVDGLGKMNVKTVSDNRSAYLTHVSAQDVDGLFRIATNKLAQGSNQDAFFIARRVSNGNQYMGRLRFPTDGTVRLRGASVINSQVTFLAPEVRVKGITHQVGQFIWVRTQVIGTNPTTIRMRAWADGTAEPTNWQYTTTDSTSTLQSSGGVGLQAYLSPNVTNAPVLFMFDDLLVQSAP